MTTEFGDPFRLGAQPFDEGFPDRRRPPRRLHHNLVGAAIDDNGPSDAPTGNGQAFERRAGCLTPSARPDLTATFGNQVEMSDPGSRQAAPDKLIELGGRKNS